VAAVELPRGRRAWPSSRRPPRSAR